MQIYVHPTCTSCKKAEALLRESGVAVERRDYFKERFAKEELRSALDRAGMNPSQVLSIRAKAYAERGLSSRNLSEDEILDLMIEEPTLLKRPLVIGAGGATVGFNRADIERLIAAEPA